MKLLLSFVIIISLSLIFIPVRFLGYIGIIICFILSALGALTGIWSISNLVSGASIKSPRVGTKSIIGTVVCEANFLSGIISCILTFNILKINPFINNRNSYILMCSNIIVGFCSYFSSVATGMICAVISMMDGKDSTIFFKVVVLEIIPASVGLIGFILGIVMNSKISQMEI